MFLVGWMVVRSDVSSASRAVGDLRTRCDFVRVWFSATGPALSVAMMQACSLVFYTSPLFNEVPGTWCESFFFLLFPPIPCRIQVLGKIPFSHVRELW